MAAPSQYTLMYPIDRKFVKKRILGRAAPFIAIYAFASLFALKVHEPSLPMLHFFFICVAMAVVLPLAILLGYKIALSARLLRTEQEIVADLVGGHKTLPLRSDAPVIIEKSLTGKFWIIRTSMSNQKLKVPVGGFPELQNFLKADLPKDPSP
jgi:hypothetical protein